MTVRERLRIDGTRNPNYEDQWIWINKRSGTAHINRACEALVGNHVPDGALRVKRLVGDERLKRCNWCWPRAHR